MMNTLSRTIKLLLAAVLVLQVTACATTSDYTPLLDAQPAAGAELTRAPRTLRLFYNALPDVSKSSLKLTGPNGDYQLRGLHTMAADDLMIEILDPVTPGEYLVEWETVVGSDPASYNGSFGFTVVAN